MQNVDIDKPTYIISSPRVFGMHSTGMQTKRGHDIVQCTKMFESRISAAATEKLLGQQKC